MLAYNINKVIYRLYKKRKGSMVIISKITIK